MSKHQTSSHKRAFQTEPGSFVKTGLPLRALLGAAIIFAAALFCYFPSLSGGFIWDDELLLTHNHLIETSDGLHKLWCTTKSEEFYPVSNSTLWIEWRLWGMNPTGYHITNLILHVVETLLIWVILRKLSVPGAFLAAMMFALHPVNVESVAWIAQRRNLMAMLFFLLSILWYFKAEMSTVIDNMSPARSLGGSWEQEIIHSPLSSLLSSSCYWLSLAAFILAMLGKGAVAVLPVLLLGILWSLRSLTRRDLMQIIPFLLLAVVLTGVNIWFQTHGKDIEIRNASFAERLLGAGCVIWFYLYKALLPLNLIFIYPQWDFQSNNPLWWLPLFSGVVVTAVFWHYRETWSRPLLFAWGFFCISLLPVMGLTDVGFMQYSLVADHYQHIAIIGVIALVTAGWSIWHECVRNKAHWMTTVVAVAAMGALTFLTWQQTNQYRDAETLFRATLEANPECWLAYNNLGSILLRRGHVQEAMDYFIRSFQINPRNAEACNNLGNMLFDAGRLSEASEYYKRALLLKPNLAETHNNLGAVLLKMGRLPEAVEHLKQALKIRPNYAEAHSNMSNVLIAMGRPQEAIDSLKLALRYKNDSPEAYYNLGNVLVEVGRLSEAIECYNQALHLNPNDAEIHENLGIALFKSGKHALAIESFRQVVRLKGEDAQAYYNLGRALALTGRLTEAIENYEKALKFARSKGQNDMAKEIENLLNSYHSGLLDTPNAQP